MKVGRSISAIERLIGQLEAKSQPKFSPAAFVDAMRRLSAERDGWTAEQRAAERVERADKEIDLLLLPDTHEKFMWGKSEYLRQNLERSARRLARQLVRELHDPKSLSPEHQHLARAPAYLADVAACAGLYTPRHLPPSPAILQAAMSTRP